MIKKCTRCKEDLPITKFYRKRSGGDGYRSMCKKCCAEESKSGHVDPVRAAAKGKHKNYREEFNATEWNENFLYC